MSQVTFDPNDHTPAALRLIMLRVQQWGCTPEEAIIRLLDELAKQPKTKEAA
jgi:hypothetical protein